MSSIFGNLEVAKRALLSHQTALNTIGHNLANAATGWYTRQRAELAPVGAQDGVAVATVRRVRDRFLDLQLLAQQQALGAGRAQDATLRRLEAIFTDLPGSGLAALLDQFFNSFQALSLRPTDQALRIGVRDQGERLATTLRELRTRADQLKVGLGTEIAQRVAEANDLVAQIAEAHRQILDARPGGSPNDLLDQRDRLVSRLGEIVGVAVTERQDGTVQLAVAGTGILLVAGAITAPLAVALDPAADTVGVTAGGVAATPRSGALASLLEARNSPTGAVRQAGTDLDTLARALIADVNRVHAGGAGLVGFATLTAAHAVSAPSVPLGAAWLPLAPQSGAFTIVAHDGGGSVVSSVTVSVTAGATTLDDVRAAIDADPNLTASIVGGRLVIGAGAGITFSFAGDTSDTLAALGINTFFSGADAGTIALDPVIAADPTKIAAALADGSGLVHPGDGTNALELARLRSRLVLGAGTETFGGFVASLVSRIGSQARQAAESLDRQETAVHLVEAMRQQTSGVSTDEELISLAQSQNAYAAAARYVTTINDVLETLLRMV